MTERKQLSHDQWLEVGKMLTELYSIVGRLGELFPGRKFTPDGHLVGSIGEEIAAHMFALRLLPTGEPRHDAEASDGRKVQIKFTQLNNSVGLRGESEPEHLLVVRLTPKRCIDVVYNGPGRVPWSKAGEKQSNGQKWISLNRLRELDAEVSDQERLRCVVPDLTLGK